MISFEELAKKEYLNSPKEVIPFIYEGNQYWIKKARATGPNKIQKFFYRFLPFELLIPPLVKDKKEALEFETSKIEKFSELGINVPKIVYKCDDFFVLEDSGIIINTCLRNKEITKEEFYYYVEKLLKEISKIHNSNDFHGGSQIRNFAYKNEEVIVIDFEESFSPKVDIQSLQYRDLLLLIVSFIKVKETKFEIDYWFILNKYQDLTGNEEIINKLKRFSNKLSFFIWFSELFFVKKVLGTDVLNFFKLFKIINSLEK